MGNTTHFSQLLGLNFIILTHSQAPKNRNKVINP